MVHSLGNLMRNSISNKQYIIPICDELTLLDDYIRIQKIRYEERLDFSMNVEQEVLQFYIPKLTLQPIIENSINYGLEAVSRTCRILVQGFLKDGQIEISISDNGPGMVEEFVEKILQGKVAPKGSGIGLRNIDERIKILYGMNYGIDIKSIPGEGTEVIVKIPCTKEAL
jgi:two-component system sensor histidine kinase YesM